LVDVIMTVKIKYASKVHSMEMQIHGDSKGKVTLDDITLWATLG